MKQRLRYETALSSPAREAQTGRSMVEMLGVLAIIGVLSIGGIAGYTQAMNQYRANEIVDELQKRLTVVAQQCLYLQKNEREKRYLSLSEFPETILGDFVKFCGAFCALDGTIDIYWSTAEWPKGLCQALKNSQIAKATVCDPGDGDCGFGMYAGHAALPDATCRSLSNRAYCYSVYTSDLIPVDLSDPRFNSSESQCGSTCCGSWCV